MSSNSEDKTNTGNLPDKREDRGLKLPTEPRPQPTKKEEKK